MCEPIEGTDAAQIASCLGLDPSKFSHSSAASSTALGGDRVRSLLSQQTDEQRYADATPLKITCPACHEHRTVHALLDKDWQRTA